MSRFISTTAAERDATRPPLRQQGAEAHAPLAADRREGERQRALRLLSHAPADELAVVLPVLATPGDVREAVQYLKKKPSGVSIVEAMDDVKRRVFEPRKVAAYESWGIVSRAGERLHLSALGWEFARRLEPEAQAYRVVLSSTAPYRSALEWMHEQNLELVTHADVAAYWQQLFCASHEHSEKATEGSVVCFFHLCQAAELGTVTIGKRGQPARLRVEREELSGFVEGRATNTSAQPASTPAQAALTTGQASNAPNQTDASPLADTQEHAMLKPTEPHAAFKTSLADAEKRLFPAAAAGARPDATASDARRPTTASAVRPLRVYISSGRDAQIVGQLQVALELADIESQIVERGELEPFPVSDAALQAMRQCEAALFVVTLDDCQSVAGDERGEHGARHQSEEADGYVFKQNLLAEIAAAFVLYDRRVVLLCDERLQLPASLGALPHFKYESGGLAWAVGVELLRAIKEYQEQVRQMSRNHG